MQVQVCNFPGFKNYSEVELQAIIDRQTDRQTDKEDILW